MGGNKMNTIIDTLQIKTVLSDVDVASVTPDNYSYIKTTKAEIHRGSFRVALSLNRRGGHYNMIESLSEHNKVYGEVMEELGISEPVIERVDIAIDNNNSFSDSFKYLLYIFELLTYSEKRSERWITTSLDTLQENTIKSMGRTFDIVFYDKENESRGRHPYKTRMEFRYKRLNTLDVGKQLDKLIALINNIEVNIPLLEKRMIELLTNVYKTNRETNFSDFVKKYDKYFYTKKIMKGVYKNIGKKQNFNQWLSRRNKTKEKVSFISKTDITKFKTDAIKSINEYKNN